MTDPKDHKWVKPRLKRQAVWVWIPKSLYEVGHWWITQWPRTLNSANIVFVANHPEGLPPPDDYKGGDAI